MDLALLVLNALLLTVLIWHGREFVKQSRALQQTHVADHERRKKQSTVEYFTANRLAMQEIRQKLDFERRDPITPEEAKQLLADEAVGDRSSTERVSDIKIFLSTFEYLAVGVNTGIFDVDVVTRMSGSLIRRTFRRYAPYIEMAREQKNQPTLYMELETLATVIEARLVQRGGEIVHS